MKPITFIFKVSIRSFFSFPSLSYITGYVSPHKQTPNCYSINCSTPNWKSGTQLSTHFSFHISLSLSSVSFSPLFLSLSIASFIHHPRSDQPGKKSKWQNLQSKSTPPRPLDGQQLTHLESSLPSNSPEGLRIFHLVLLYRK